MIIGHNEFRLNEATVAQAIEDYINARILETDQHITVTSVSEINTGSGDQFRCNVRPKTEPKE